jgi:hypothetical protein
VLSAALVGSVLVVTRVAEQLAGSNADVRAFRAVCRVSRRRAGVGDGQDGTSAGAGPLLGAPVNAARGLRLSVIGATARPRRLAGRGDTSRGRIRLAFATNRARPGAAVPPTDGPFTETKELLG